VFNPTGEGGVASTLAFDPVGGCEDPLVAAERAEDMLPCVSTGDEREYWTSAARDALAAFLHAAALGGLPMQAIAEWVADPDQAKAEVTRLLRRSLDPTGAYATVAEQFLSTNERTRSSITTSMRPALKWLINPHARAATQTSQPSASGQFSVAELLRTRGTVYLVGSEAAHTASLVAALTGHIAREARRIAGDQPGGRLDPHLLLALDEAALICPIPLDRWSADMGGRGIQIIASFQSRSQLIGKWGPSGAGTLLNNAGAVLLFGGSKDEGDLRCWSTLFGHRDEELLTTDEDGQITGRSVRQVPVLSPAQLAGLPEFRVVAWRSGLPPVIGWASMFWRRRDVRAQNRALKRAEAQVLTEAKRSRRPARKLPATPALVTPILGEAQR
jgi:type IV secretory pathway TraG/TraD family ATPase VirD4